MWEGNQGQESSVKGILPALGPKTIHKSASLPEILRRIYRRLRSSALRFENSLISRSAIIAALLASDAHRKKLKYLEMELARCRSALLKEPRDLAAWCNLADTLQGLGRLKNAVDCYERALLLAPDDRTLWRKRANALRSMGKKVDLPALDPQSADGWVLRAGAFALRKMFSDAAYASDKALELDPANFHAIRIGISSRIRTCDWRKRSDDKHKVASLLKDGQIAIGPLNHRRISDSEEESLALARLKSPSPKSNVLWTGEQYDHDRIRLGYICAEFHRHPTTFALAGVFEHHDQTRFEKIAISLGKADTSEIRRRVEASFDHFVDAKAMNDADVAQLLRDLEVDIAIDISGHAGDGRLGIFSHRPAPLQVSYLAYPGTTGAQYFDYIIADHIVIPRRNHIHYTEKVAYLPHSYQPIDDKRPVSATGPSRGEIGLPETAFVFACFNQEAKFSPEIFAAWMRILSSVEGSVLWTLSFDQQSAENLRQEAKRCGIAPDRLVFGRPVPQEEHLARVRLADLFLDTLPYNAHATACDALWAGLPILTCLGEAFPGRVAASVLFAAGLPELVTTSLSEYEALAIALAHDRERLKTLREKLGNNRKAAPLFDTARYTRNLERAYICMWERQREGLPPSCFSVTGIADCMDGSIESRTSGACKDSDDPY